MRRLRTSRLAWLLAALAALQSVQRGTCAAQETTQDLYSTSHQRPGGNAPVDSAEQGSSTSRQKPDAAIGDLPSHGPHDPLPMGHANARLELLRCRGKASKAPSKLCTHLVEDMGFSCDDVTTESEDGFLLGLHRISLIPEAAKKRRNARAGDGGEGNPSLRGREGREGGLSGGAGKLREARRARWRAPRSLEQGRAWLPLRRPSGRLVKLRERLQWAVPATLLRFLTPGLTVLTAALNWVLDTLGQWHKGMHERRHQAVAVHGAPVDAVPVLLLHGLLLRAECWLMSQPRSSSLPFQLARAGFDVWLGNVRCSPWAASQGDTVLEYQGNHPLFFSQKKDWDWTFDELARYDLPAMVAKVLDASGSPFLLYVGHSQGTLTLLSSLSMGWLPVESIKAAYLLAPVAFLGNLSSDFVRRAATIDFDIIVEDTGLHHFSFHNELGQRIIGEVCSEGEINCSSLITAITGPNCCIDMERARDLLPWFPLSTSVKNMAHFAQAVRSGLWRMFDYGWRNLVVYGSLHPPTYQPKKVPSLHLTLACGDLDTLSTPPDVQKLLLNLSFQPRVVRFPSYAHLDFIMGDTRIDDNRLFRDVVGFLKNATK